MAPFNIRPMVEEDLPAVVLVENQVYEFPWSERNFFDSLRAGYHMHGMWQDTQLVGYIIMMSVVDEFHLLNISIRGDFQGHGYGKLLLRWGMEHAKSHQATGMLLEVRPSNLAAKNLYDKEGFKLIGTRKNYYPSRLGREDALVMLRKFADNRP